MSSSPRRQRPTKVDLKKRSSPNQNELGVITNAFRAALQYSPLTDAPPHHDDLYAYVAREIERRFWTDIYVDRPEIREIALALETGQLVLITGERGSGKSTAIQAVLQQLSLEPEDEPEAVNQLNLLPFVLDANTLTASMRDEESVERTIQEKVWEFLDDQIGDSRNWLAHLYATHPTFEEFRTRLSKDRLKPPSQEDFLWLAEADDYPIMVNQGLKAFVDSDPGDKIRSGLTFIGEQTEYEPLIVIDNIDHLRNDLASHCGEVLAWILGSSPHRVRGAIAVRTENADTIRQVIDTEPRPQKIQMSERALSSDSLESPAIEVTFTFIEKRLRILREKETIARMRAAINPERGSRLAADYSEDDLGKFLDSVMNLLEEVIYDVFRTDEKDATLRRANKKFAEAIHYWHNGSLRECGLSLTIFASDILQDKAHMYELKRLLREVSTDSGKASSARRRHLRRMTLSLLYRHLLFWAAPDNEKTRPPRNVMVFDADEETADPPLHFLRLRILQYLARRPRSRAVISKIRRDIGQLDIKQERIDEALRELAVKRTDDDAGLLRIDGLHEVQPDIPLRDDATVQLLDAGKFLVTDLYVTAEYLFWSAVTIPAASDAAGLPATIKPQHIQSDLFRTDIATRFLEKFLLEKFRDEHPYLRGYSDEWTPRRARARVRLYEKLFGFTRGNWFLDRAADSVGKFIPIHAGEKYEPAKASLDRLSELARALDRVVDYSGPPD